MQIGVGLGNVSSVVVAAIFCAPVRYAGSTWPTVLKSQLIKLYHYLNQGPLNLHVPCSPYNGAALMVASPYCQDDLVLVQANNIFFPAIQDQHNPHQECDVTASSARDVSTLPGNVLLSDDSIWAPAHRFHHPYNARTFELEVLRVTSLA